MKNENRKVTLTIGQLKRLIRESDDDPRLTELKKAIRKIIGFFPDNVTISDNGFTCGDIQFKVDASEPIPWRAVSVDKPITIEGPLGDQMAGYVIGRFITADKSSVQRIVDLFK